jgi:hypothetical protein
VSTIYLHHSTDLTGDVASFVFSTISVSNARFVLSKLSSTLLTIKDYSVSTNYVCLNRKGEFVPLWLPQ